MTRGQAYYNEIDAYAVEWTRRLVEGGHVARGIVDDRSIADVDAADLAEFAQCHFFSGIAIWSAALRLAGWPDDAEVWTGSCPCQPFSGAGRREGFDDVRHLWPTWFRRIAERRPPVVLGEQVAGRDGLAWLDLVQADLEGAGYTVAAFNLCAGGVGAPHRRQRLYFVAIADGERLEGVRVRLLERRRLDALSQVGRGGGGGGGLADGTGSGAGLAGSARGGVADAEGDGSIEGRRGAIRVAAEALDRRAAVGSGSSGELRGVADAGGEGWKGSDGSESRGRDRSVVVGDSVRMDHTGGEGGRGHAGAVSRAQGESASARSQLGRVLDVAVPAGPTRGFWQPAEWVACRDGKYRPIEPGTFPLAHGAPARVGRLRAAGNAIVRPLAAIFVEAVIGHLLSS